VPVVGKALTRLCCQNSSVGSLWVKGFTPLQRERRAEAGPGPYSFLESMPGRKRPVEAQAALVPAGWSYSAR